MTKKWTAHKWGLQMMFPREPNHWTCTVLPDKLKGLGLIEVEVREVENPAQLMAEVYFTDERDMLYVMGDHSELMYGRMQELLNEAKQHGLIDESFRLICVCAVPPHTD